MSNPTSPSAAPSAAPMTIALALRVIVPFALGYFLSYFYRAVNAVIAPNLIADLSLDASALGLLTSVYFLTFAAFQLPLGMLLDHYGPRKVETLLLIFAAVGAAVFAIAPSLSILTVGRGLIGFGVSACLMAAFKAYVMWFPKERLALVNGIQMMAGGLGALAATQPVEMMLAVTDWRGVFWILAGLTALSSLVVYVVVPERSAAQKAAGRTSGAKLGDTWAGVVAVLKSDIFWRVAPLCMLSQASFTSVVGLWSGPWLRDVAGLTRDQVATNLFWIAASMVAGFIAWGVVADRLHKLFGIKTMNVAIIGMFSFFIIEAVIAAELSVGHAALVLPVWMAFGFFGTSGILPYAALSQAFPAELAGRVNTGLNLFVFILAFAMQWAVGAIIDLWPQAADGSFAREGYQTAFALMFALQVLAAAWYMARRHVRV